LYQLQVSQAQPLVIQSEVMKEEMINAESLEYTPNSLPLLLHQVNIYTKSYQTSQICYYFSDFPEKLYFLILEAYT